MLGWVGFPFYLEDPIFIFGSVHKILFKSRERGGSSSPFVRGVLNTIYGERERDMKKSQLFWEDSCNSLFVDNGDFELTKVSWLFLQY